MREIKYSFRLLSKQKKENSHPDIKQYIPRPDIRPKRGVRKMDDIESDNKKRSFLKLAGVVGAGVVAASLIPKRADALVFGSHPTPTSTGVKDASNARINPATEETLGSIKSQTDLLSFDAGSNPANLKVNIAAGAVGVKNVGGTQVNPATEDTLALIQAKTSQLSFSGSNLMTTVGGSGNTVGLKDTTGTAINPATDDSIIYLRRMVKIMESQAAVDASNRQRVVVDSFGSTVTGTGVSGAGVPRVTVSTDSSFSATITSLNGWNDQMFQDVARNTYANGIRYNLSFS